MISPIIAPRIKVKTTEATPIESTLSSIMELYLNVSTVKGYYQNLRSLNAGQKAAKQYCNKRDINEFELQLLIRII